MFGRKKTPVTPTPAPAPATTPALGGRAPVKIVQDEDNPIAYDLNKIKDLELLAEAKAVAVNLKKDDLQGIRARVFVLVDVSTSMSADFRNGNVQALIRRCLAFGLNVDTDGKIEVIPFGYRAGTIREVDASGVDSAVHQLAANLEPSTNLTDALNKVLSIAKDTDEVLYVFVVTDGNPNDTRSAAEAYAALASYAVFIKNVAIRDVPFLRQVDEYDPPHGGVPASAAGGPAGRQLQHPVHHRPVRRDRRNLRASGHRRVAYLVHCRAARRHPGVAQGVRGCPTRTSPDTLSA
jgi:uncharacterized protein YegL